MTTTTAPEQGTLEHLDPESLILDPNVRSDVELDKVFLASIEEHGVFTPILGHRVDGAVHVRAGQRRTLGARQVKCATVPVYVIEGTGDEAERIIVQLIENDNRAALNEAERIAAWRQLELEGLSVTQIAKRTGNARDRIKTGLTLAGNETGTTLVAEFGLTLDQAAALLDFEDDQDTVAALTEVAYSQPDYFPVAVEKARTERKHQQMIAEAEAEELAKGHRVLAEHPVYGEAPYALHHFENADGTKLRAEDVTGKEGVAVRIYVNYNHDVIRSYYLDDPKAHGHEVPVLTGSGAPKGPMTDEQKAERKALIANNKEWDASVTVRQEWLSALLSRKTLPKGADQVIAMCLTLGGPLVAQSMERGSAIACKLLGLEQVPGNGLDAYREKHPTRARQVTLAVVLGGIEQTCDRYTWRNPSERTARYLQALAEWGYPLCPVERIAAKLDPADD